jgi:hypothetical protein
MRRLMAVLFVALVLPLALPLSACDTPSQTTPSLQPPEKNK